jgi:hypothetical protein
MPEEQGVSKMLVAGISMSFVVKTGQNKDRLVQCG